MVSGWQQQEKASVWTVRTAVAGVLVDESFAITTEEIKKCLSITQSFIKHLNCDQAQQSSKTFCSCLVHVLEKIIEKLKKRNGVINSETLWTNYHKLTTSQAFRTGWEEFLECCDVDKELMIYKYIIDETFTKIVKQSVHTTVSEQNNVLQNDDQEPSLTYEEENAAVTFEVMLSMP